MEAGVLAFTEKGFRLAKEIKRVLEKEKYEVEIKPGDENLYSWVEERFNVKDLMIFIGASAIAVRAIAPLVKSKIHDPAVISMDHGGRFVIPLLSGHVGGANRIAEYIAESIGGIPVITTATETDGTFSPDRWAVENNMIIDDIKPGKDVAMAILHGSRTGLYSRLDVAEVHDSLVKIDESDETDGHADIPKVGIRIGYGGKQVFERELFLIPRRLVLGIGCRRGVSQEKIQVFVEKKLRDADVDIRAVYKIASIDLKSDEKGLIGFAKHIDAEFVTYTPEELLRAEGDFKTSEFVSKITGVDNVCQRAACIASDNGRLLIPKQAEGGVTMALYEKKEVLYVR